MRAFSSPATRRAKAIVRAITHYDDAAVLAEVSEGLGEAMVGHQTVEAWRQARRWPVEASSPCDDFAWSGAGGRLCISRKALAY
jgi:hypothetical protein